VRVSAAIVSVAVDPTTQRVLLILAAVLVGSSVGLLGALIFALVTSARGRRPRAPAVRMSAPDMRPAPIEPIAEPPAPPASPFIGPAIGPMPALFAVDSEIVRERHRDLYDTEYAKQLDHVDALRQMIGTRMAVGGEPATPPAQQESDE
jgi:hypothetical protein